MAGADDLINVAAAELGYTEQWNNKTKYGKWYGMDGQPWCAMFVSWASDRSGNTSVIPKHAYTPSGVAWFKAKGAYYSKPKRGDIVYFRFPGMGRVSHVGIVERVNSNGTIQTIEGNSNYAGSRTGGKVVRLTRSKYIDGYGRPDYAGATTLREGSSGDAVAALQRFLIMHRFLASGADGAFGPLTKEAVVAFQKVTSIAVNGEVGTQTYNAMAAFIPTLNLPYAPKDFGNEAHFPVVLTPGSQLTSANKKYILVLQRDGNFVGYEGQTPFWSLGRIRCDQVALQADGNMVAYLNGFAVWATGTAGKNPSHLALQDDRNIVLYSGQKAVWAIR